MHSCCQKLCIPNCHFLSIVIYRLHSNQWDYLRSIKKVKITLLDSLFQELNQAVIYNKDEAKQPQNTQDQVNISLTNTFNLDRTNLPLPLINFLKEELNFQNTEFFIKKKLGKNTWETKRYFRFIEETDKEVITPRGITGKVLRFCRSNNIVFDFRDDRKKLTPVSILFNASLREYQKPALAATSKKDLGIIVAPPGAGKTIIGLKIIAKKQQPALIIVHRKQLAEQWTERIQAFMGIPKKEIGKIGQGKCTIGKKVTIAMIQSLVKQLEKPEANKIQEAFGAIIVDECHHIPAETFHKTLAKLSTFYLYGLTATPFRKYSDGKLIFIHLGEVIAEISPADIPKQQTAKIIIRNTSLEIPFNSRTDNFEILSKVLIHDSARNKLILQDVTRELNSGKRVVILTERKEHIDSLHQYLKQSYETITLSGDDTENSRNARWKQLRAGNYQALITTGQYFGEGADLQNASVLFLVYPFSFEGKLIQYIGRVQRSELTPTIYDYHDHKINYLHKLFLKRNAHYRKLQKQTSLLDEKEPEKEFNNHSEIFTLEKKIGVPFDQLEFGYGTIAFQYEISQMNTKLEFEIENSHIRPEFNILKPYFAKVLRRKSANIEIMAEFKHGKLISQLATSTDLNNINREIVDSVKFRFVQKKFFGKGQIPTNQNLPALAQLQPDDQQGGQLFDSEEELLENLLRGRKVKHQKQLLYLAEKHDNSILKIRFVINPFSFVFLLTGEEQYHLIMESLDTEEATYIWHIDKNRRNLVWNLKKIDKQLNLIRNKGRQTFLDSEPENFSRILHDYSDPRKGFFKWKDLLEERLV